MPDRQKYAEIFDYLSAPALPTETQPTIVFGRNDARVAHAVGELAAADLTQAIVISGGVGKDTGDLLKRNYRSEAHYLGSELDNYAASHDITLPSVMLEEKATNGGENAAFSLQILHEHGVALQGLTTVAHATSSLRLAEGVSFAAKKYYGIKPVVYRVPTAYPFNVDNPEDQDESAKELLRLADWPTEGILLPRDDLPENLVEFARDRHGDTPKPLPSWGSSLLRLLPKGSRLHFINLATRLNRK